MADNLGRPSGLSTVYDPLVMAAMQSRIAELADQVKALDDRLRAIESKLGVTAPASTNPASAPATPGFGTGILPATTPGLAPAGGGAGTGP